MSKRGDTWIIAKLEAAQGGLHLTLTDDRGIHLTDDSASVTWLVEPFGALTIAVPVRWQDFLKSTLARGRRDHVAPDLDARVIPIFLEPTPGTEAFDWEYGLAQLTQGIAQPVRSAPPDEAPRAPFQLPLGVLAVDDTASALGALQSVNWYAAAQPDERGIFVSSQPIEKLHSTLREVPYDILIARDTQWQRVRSAISALPLDHPDQVNEPSRRPRLVILVREGRKTPVLHRRFHVPGGVALLILSNPPGQMLEEFLKDLFYGIFHDQPLHGALHEAMGGTRMPGTWLFANPDTNHNLRISDALSQVGTLRDALRYGASAGDVENFIIREGRQTRPWVDLAQLLRTADSPSRSLRAAAQSSGRLSLDFSRETRGLVPLSEDLARLRGVEFDSSLVHQNLMDIAKQPQMVQAIAEVQQRHVDVTMQFRDEGIASYVAIQKNMPLLPDRRYRVCVHIGHRSADSLVIGEPPPLDPLLPELEPGQDGYHLEVAVFSRDFRLLNPRVQPLYLARLGGSRPIYFEVRTPDEKDAAELRVNVYHRNHLLQAFLLTAEVRENGHWKPTPAVQVELDVSTTAGFANLQELAPRALSIGVNLDTEGATHWVMIKKGDHASHPLLIGDDLVREYMQEFRSLLKKYTGDDNNDPLFPTYPEGAPRTAEFDEAIRSLAQFGKKIYLGIFQPVEGEINDDLREIREGEDLTLQIARHRGDAVFPWPVIYDFLGPSDGCLKTAPVCRGSELPEAPVAVNDGLQTLRGCPHNPGREVYCIQGFWGFRHRIEQIIPAGKAANTASQISMSTATHSVCLALSVDRPCCTALSSELQGSFGAQFVRFPPPPPPDVPFGPFMWSEQTRPAVLVLLSHLMNPGTGSAQILLAPATAAGALTLTADQVSEFTRAMNVWKGTNSLVLLMACESAATTVSTLNDFTMAFRAAGASAIVGTEVPVYSSLATRFAKDLIGTLRTKRADGELMQLGQAVRMVVNQLLNEGNPMGLLFNYCGNANLSLT